MRAASFALVVLGGLLSFGPLAWLWLAGRQRAATLTAERTAIRSAAERGDDPPPNASTTWLDVLTTSQDIELAIIDNATTAARWPLLLVAVGIVASTLGGVLSLYV